MRPRNCQHMTTLQNVFCQPLWAADVGHASVQYRFHQWKFRCSVGMIDTADDVANNKNIGFQCELLCAKTLYQINAQSTQLVAHRRINARIATCDFVTCFAGQCRNTAHEGAANA